MARTKGVTNKEKPAKAFTMPTADRINLLANIIVDILIAEQSQKTKR